VPGRHFPRNNVHQRLRHSHAVPTVKRSLRSFIVGIECWRCWWPVFATAFFCAAFFNILFLFVFYNFSILLSFNNFIYLLSLNYFFLLAALLFFFLQLRTWTPTAAPLARCSNSKA
jgi:hypothetical protein